jgi:hypothetical protein
MAVFEHLVAVTERTEVKMVVDQEKLEACEKQGCLSKKKEALRSDGGLSRKEAKRPQ